MVYRSRTTSITQERTGLVSLVTQYLPEAQSPNGLTLVCSHSTSNHKEQWEIIISELFTICPGVVSEAWAIDWQNHGQSALINEKILSNRIATLDDYADVLRQFLESPYLMGKKVVAIGHSTGTCALALSIFQCTLPVSPVMAVILFEPVYIIPPVKEKDDRIIRGVMNIRGVKMRKATFSSLTDASKWTRKRMPWKTWDERMFNCYMKYGFHSVTPGAEEVTLNCTLEQEVEACAPNVPILAGHLYPKLCSMLPVHGIFGERPEMYTNQTRDMFFDGKDGRCMESVQIIPKAGHLLVQEYPSISARMIANVLRKHLGLPPIEDSKL